DALLCRAHALAARHRGDAAARAPQPPALVGPDRVKSQAGPFAEIEFDEIVAIFDGQIEPRRQDLGRLTGALQWARVERIDFLVGEAIGDRGDLEPAAGGKADTGCPPGEHTTAQHMLAVPQQMKYRHWADLLKGTAGWVNLRVSIHAESTVRSR